MFEFYFIDEMRGEQGSSWLKFALALLPIATLVLGIFLNRWFAKADKRRKDVKSCQDLVTEIELLEDPVKKQIESADEFIEDLQKPQLVTPRFTSILSLKLDRLSLLDRFGVIDHLERQLKSRREAINKANELFIGCDVVTIRYHQLQEIANEYASNTTPFEDWRREANAQLRMLVSLMVDIERSGAAINDDPLIGPALRITEGSTSAEGDVFDLFEQVHKPLMELYAKNRLDPRVQDLADLNAKAIHSIMALQRERFYAIAKMENIKKKLGERFNTLLGQARAIDI